MVKPECLKIFTFDQNIVIGVLHGSLFLMHTSKVV